MNTLFKLKGTTRNAIVGTVAALDGEMAHWEIDVGFAQWIWGPIQRPESLVLLIATDLLEPAGPAEEVTVPKMPHREDLGEWRSPDNSQELCSAYRDGNIWKEETSLISLHGLRYYGANA